MLAQHGPVPEISITFDPATRCYGFSTRLPGMRPHWMIDTFTSLEDVMRWVDPWRERVWEEPGDADEKPDTRVAERAWGALNSAKRVVVVRNDPGREAVEVGFPDSSPCGLNRSALRSNLLEPSLLADLRIARRPVQILNRS